MIIPNFDFITTLLNIKTDQVEKLEAVSTEEKVSYYVSLKIRNRVGKEYYNTFKEFIQSSKMNTAEAVKEISRFSKHFLRLMQDLRENDHTGQSVHFQEVYKQFLTIKKCHGEAFQSELYAQDDRGGAEHLFHSGKQLPGFLCDHTCNAFAGMSRDRRDTFSRDVL